MKAKIITLSVLIAAIVLFFLSFDFRVVIHSFVNLFSVGRSDVKSGLFLGYLVLLVVGLIIFRSKEIKDVLKTKIGRIVSISLISAHTYSLLLYFYFIISYNLNPIKLIAVYGNYNHTAMLFMHNHIGKGFISVFLKLFNVESLGVDSGDVMPYLIPNILLILGAIISLITIISVIYLVILKISSLDLKIGYRRNFYIIGIIITAFMSMKSILDGGLLGGEALIGLSFFFLFVFDNLITKRAVAFVSAMGFFILFVMYFIGYYGDSNFGKYILSYFTYILVFSAIYAIYKDGFSRKNVLIVILALIPMLSQLKSNLESFKYLNTDIYANEKAYVLAYRPINKPEYKMLDKYQKVTLYEYSSKEGGVVKDLIKDSGTLYSLSPVIIPWLHCKPSAERDTYVFEVRSYQKLNRLNYSTNTYTFDASLLDSDNGLNHYLVKLFVSPCKSVIPLAMVTSVVSMQLDRFFLDGLTKFDDGDGLHI